MIAPLLIGSLAAYAQTSHNHPLATPTTNDPGIIDGAKSPELIPELTAWRLWLLAVSATDAQHPELDDQRQTAFLNAAGFRTTELYNCKQVLAHFRADYAQLIEDHNKLIEAGKTDGEFLARRDALVDAARISMLNRTVNGDRVIKFLVKEKVRMQIPRQEAQ